jgi:hypothetical protein
MTVLRRFYDQVYMGTKEKKGKITPGFLGWAVG